MITNRYRTRSIPHPAGVFIHKRIGNNVFDNVSSRDLGSKSSQQIYDYTVKNFKVLQAKGMLFNNHCFNRRTSMNTAGALLADAYDSVLINGVQTPVHESYHLLGGAGLQQLMAANVVKHALLPPVDGSELAIRSRIACLGNVNSTKWDVGTFLGEWSKTKRIHKDICDALLKVMKQRKTFVPDRIVKYKTPIYDAAGHVVLNKHGSPRYSVQNRVVPGHFSDSRVKDGANAYLVGRYGVAPLLNDLDKALKFFRQKTPPKRKTAHGKATSQQKTTHVSEVFIGEINRNLLVTSECVRTFTHRNGILYESSLPAELLANIGLSRPLSTVWELTRLSFAVDWLVDVGSWLDAMQPNFASKTLVAWESTQEEIVHTFAVNDSGSVSNGTFRYTISWGENRQETESVYRRNPWNAHLPTRPAFGSGLNFIRSVDSAALVLQMFGSRFRK